MTQRIYVGNLPYTATEDEVRQLFANHGEVTDCSLPIDRETGRPRGFGFVEMETEDATKAMQALDGHNFGGRTLRVNEAQARQDRGGGGGGGGGGGETQLARARRTARRRLDLPRHRPSRAAVATAPRPRRSRRAWLFADDAGTCHRTRRQSRHDLRTHRGVDQEGRTQPRTQQGTLFITSR